MAYQGDPVSKGPAGFENGPLTPDDLERLATAFRPSWELDEAPFTGAGSLSAADVQALQAGGTHADVRAATQMASAAFPPAPAARIEPVESMVIAAPVVAPPPPPAASPWAPVPAAPQFVATQPPVQPATVQPHVSAPPSVQLAPELSPASREALAATRIIPRRPPAPLQPSAMRPRIESIGSDMVRLARPSRKPLWIGLGGLLVGAAGIGAWLSMSSSTDKSLPALPAVVATATHALPDIPPPPPAAASAAPAAAAAPVPAAAATTASLTPLKPATSVPVTSLPVAAAPPPATPHYAAAAPAPHPYAAPTPAPKPTVHAKSGSTTIVHDVPF
jgi:hypothetical protein